MKFDYNEYKVTIKNPHFTFGKKHLFEFELDFNDREQRKASGVLRAEYDDKIDRLMKAYGHVRKGDAMGYYKNMMNLLDALCIGTLSYISKRQPDRDFCKGVKFGDIRFDKIQSVIKFPDDYHEECTDPDKLDDYIDECWDEFIERIKKD